MQKVLFSSNFAQFEWKSGNHMHSNQAILTVQKSKKQD